jgi:hypothetical protein
MLVLGVTVVLHLLVPAMLLSWHWLGVERSRTAWFLKALAVGSYLVLLQLAGLWVALPWYLGYVYLGIWAAAVIFQYRRIRAESSQSHNALRALIYGAAAALFIAASIYAWMGHRPHDEEAVDLAFPLRGGTYYIISGGSNGLMNLHFKTLRDDRLQRFRGQSYAVDIVKLNRYGIRSSFPLPSKLTDYEIFGDAVYAPCAGAVMRTENSLPDLVPPEHDRVNLAGNFVAIDCKGVRVLLAHLKQGSVLVKTGEAVRAGQKLGQIGNSGNTDEPHLHIHAERPADPNKLLDAQPVPIRFDGRLWARNDRIRTPGT